MGPKPQKTEPAEVKHIVISGTNFWNPGDDFVRDGVVRILNNLYGGYRLNFLFYNFNQDFYPQSKFAGIANTVARLDLDTYGGHVDAIVIAGLSAGIEIADLYKWIIKNDLQDRVYLIGAGYENAYVDEHISQEPAATIFKHARVITGRTQEKPNFITDHNLSYHHIHCPAILSVPAVKPVQEDKKIEKIAFSIQLPPKIGINNQSCSEKMHKLTMQILFALHHDYEIAVIAHHKSEYLYFLNLFRELEIKAPVIFSSFYQDLFAAYPEYDLIISTRLHACLYGNGHGLPAIIINDTDRHTRCLKGFPHSKWVNSFASFKRIFTEMQGWNLAATARAAEEFKAGLLRRYLDVLAGPFGVEGTAQSASRPVPVTVQVQPQAKTKDPVGRGNANITAKSVNGSGSVPIKEFSREDLAQRITASVARDVDTKRRVLAILERLTKDHWLKKNIESYHRLIADKVPGFDAASFINWYAEHFRPRNYLEVGVRRGRSMAQVLTQSPETQAFGFDMWIPDYGSDPAQNVQTSNPGPDFVRQEFRNLGIASRPTLTKGNSHQTLPRFWRDPKSPQQFDLIFVDGDHTYDGAKLDLDICFEHLAAGGALVFDDILHPAHPELEQLWAETKDQYPECICIEHPSGMGTGVVFKPPFNHLGRYLKKHPASEPDQSQAESTGAVDANPAANTAELPIHFFTIVLNGEPFIRHHIDVFKHLPFTWHWHIVEGVADLKHDTAWSLNFGGKITAELHQEGLSNDGTTAYLDALKNEFPENITIYRKSKGAFWDGKIEMVNAPIPNIREECLLWQVDADELWTLEQLCSAREMFLYTPDRTAAYYFDHFFVGPDLAITTIDTYGNHKDYEWLRTWRFKPGCRWESHEPPKLCLPGPQGTWNDVAGIKPFRQAETKSRGLVFQHYAYATEDQLRFKEVYYGYKRAIKGWRALQAQDTFPVFLREYFPWVKDDAQVDTLASRNIEPLGTKGKGGQWQFNHPGPPGTGGPTTPVLDKATRILYVRTDAIGDNLLSMPIVRQIKETYPTSEITVLCQAQIAELYAPSPYVDRMISFDKQRADADAAYRSGIIRQLQKLRADIALNPVYSREPLTDLFTLGSQAKTRIAFQGNLCNITATEREKHNPFYTQVLPDSLGNKSELDMHRIFLNAIGIDAPPLQPRLHLTEQDEAFADQWFKTENLKPEKTIALFAGALNEVRRYHHYGDALSPVCRENDFAVIALGAAGDAAINQENLDQVDNNGTINLCGRTTLRQAAALLKRCRLAVGAETGLAHMACAVETPNVLLLGGGHFGRFMPYSPLTTVACLPLDCYRCDWKCAYSQAHCIQGVNPPVLTGAIRRALAESTHRPRIIFQQDFKAASSKEHPRWRELDPDTISADVETMPASERRSAKKGEWLVSAIVSTYNSERFIRGCLEDLEAQTIAERLEIIVVDSGSEENEGDIIGEFKERYRNIKYIRTEQRETVYQAWNRGIRAAGGKYVTNANADDRHCRDACEKLVAALEANPQAILAYRNSHVTPLENGVYGSAPLSGTFKWPEFDPALLFRGNYIGPHPMWRRSAHDRYGWFDEELVVAGDYDFWLRMAGDEVFVHGDEPLGLYLNAPGSVEHANLKTSMQEVQRVRNRHWPKGKSGLPPLDSNFLVTAERPAEQTAGVLKDKIPITAIIAAYNEGDVIYHVIRDLVEQDINVIFIDHHSTDNTLAEVRKWEGKGVIRIEAFPEDAGLKIPRDVYAWRHILRRKQALAAEMGPGWYLHTDADEFREAPWPGIKLRAGIERVDREGYNAINFKIYDFKPTGNDFKPGQDVRECLTHYDPDIHTFNNVQIKCWKNYGQTFNLWKSGGHAVAFEGRKVYPTPFILRHYAIRSQSHGLQKVFAERKSRFDTYEREARWHDQYDKVADTEHNFLKKSADLILYNRAKACRQVQSAGRSSSEGYHEFTRPEVQALVSKDARVILDVGCAAGRMAGEIKRKLNAEVWGIEPVTTAARRAEEGLDRVIAAPVEQAIAQLPDGYFDCVIFADVLEHLQHPEQVLHDIQDKLTARGEVIASIPNVAHWSVVKNLLAGQWEYEDAGILDRTHLKFFTRESIKTLFKQTGFDILEMQATRFGRQKIPAALATGLMKSGFDMEKFTKEANHYQYLVKSQMDSRAAAPEKSRPVVSMIILAHNALDYTKKCIASIQAHTELPHEIIFVDNGSTDGTQDYLKKLSEAHAHYRLVANRENTGFAAGNNQGLAIARGGYLLLLNNDVVVTSGWLERLLACAEKNLDIGIVGPLSNYVAGPQLTKDVSYDTTSLDGLDTFAAELALENAGQIKRLPRVVGFCMLIKKEVVDRIGGLDARYGLGNFEDDDFSLRAVLAGYGSCIAKDCFIHHFGNRTFRSANLDYEASLKKNWEIFKHKWNLSEDLPYGSSWEIKDAVRSGFEPSKHFISVSDESGIDSDRTQSGAHRQIAKQKQHKSVAAKESGTVIIDLDAHRKSKQPTASVFQKKGDTFMKTSNPAVCSPETEAALVAYMEEKLQGSVNAAVIHNDLGIMYCRTGENPKALENFKAATDLDPANTSYLKNLADFYYSIMQDSRAALAVYKRLVALDPVDTTVLTILGHIHLAEKEFGEAKTYYARILELDPGNTEVQRYLENLMPAGGPVVTAEKTESPEALYNHAQNLVEQGDAVAACRQLESLVAAYPGHALAYNDLGVLYYQAGNKEKSLAAYERAVTLEPQNITFKKNLADFRCVEMKQIEAALELYNEILAVEPDDLETLLTMGKVCAMLGRKEDARHFYNQAQAVEPWNAEIKQLLEDVETGKQPSEADHSVEEKYTQAQGLAENGQTAEALAKLQELVALHPDLAVVHNDLGVLHYQTGDVQAAAAHYEKAVEIDPGNAVYRKNLADFYCIAQGRLEEGMQIYVDLLAQEPDDVEILAALGQICERLDKPDDARGFYDMALNVEPWNSQIRQLVDEMKKTG